MSSSEAKEEGVGEGGAIAFWVTMRALREIPNRVIKLSSVGKSTSVAGANLVPHRLAVPSHLSSLFPPALQILLPAIFG